MTKQSYNMTDRLLGGLVFVVAAVVYCLTVEPSASFWDCPEFILASHKLETGHSPGAPFFMLMANVVEQNNNYNFKFINEVKKYMLPDTGGGGVIPLYLTGAALMAAPLLQAQHGEQLLEPVGAPAGQSCRCEQRCCDVRIDIEGAVDKS